MGKDCHTYFDQNRLLTFIKTNSRSCQWCLKMHTPTVVCTLSIPVPVGEWFSHGVSTFPITWIPLNWFHHFIMDHTQLAQHWCPIRFLELKTWNVTGMHIFSMFPQPVSVTVVTSVNREHLVSFECWYTDPVCIAHPKKSHIDGFGSFTFSRRFYPKPLTRMYTHFYIDGTLHIRSN